MLRGDVTEHGFIVGPVKVEVMCEGRETGSVILRLHSAKKTIQVYVTRTGKMRVFSEGPGGEWKEAEA